MPTIPTYNGPQVASKPLNPPQLGNVDVSSGSRVAAQQLAGVADAFDKRAERDAQTEAWNAQARLNEDFVSWNAEARKNAQGANAKGYAEAVKAWWDKAKSDTFAKLSPLAQEQIAKSLSTVRLTALESASGYENQQLDIGERSALQSTVSQLANQAIAAGADKAQPVLDQAISTLRTYGAKKGVDVEPEVLKATTGVHTTLINTLLQGPTPERAQTYFEANKKQIDASLWDNVETGIKKGIEAGLTQANGARLAATYDFTQTAEAYKAIDATDWAPSLKAAVKADVKERHAIAQADFDKRTSLTVGRLATKIESGMTLAQLRRDPEFVSLDPAYQGQVLAAKRQRDEHQEAMATARENREWNKVQRLREQEAQRTQAAAWAYSDPEVLTSMSREKVAALSLTLGPVNTQQLLNKYDALKGNPARLGEARMDQDQFLVLARTAGLDISPKNDEQKAALANAKNRVEDAIALAEKGGKRLSREEKGALMQREIGMEVTVGRSLWFDRSTNYLNLRPEDEAKVVVPGAAAQSIVARARQQSGNPALQLTPEQIRAAYLQGLRSKAANGN